MTKKSKKARNAAYKQALVTLRKETARYGMCYHLQRAGLFGVYYAMANVAPEVWLFRPGIQDLDSYFWLPVDRKSKKIREIILEFVIVMTE